MKKLSALLVVTLMTIALITGCATQPAASAVSTQSAATESPSAATPASTSAAATATPTPAAEPTKAPVKITLSHCQGEWMWPILKEIGDKWTEVSGNTVEFLYVPADTYDTWIQTQLAAGTEPDGFFGGTKIDYFRSGKLADLTAYFNAPNKYNGEIWKDNFLQGALENCIDKENGNKYYAIATTNVTVNLYYNKDLMTSLGLPDKAPATWSDVLNICDTASKSGKNIVPFAVMNSMAWNLSWIHGSFLEDLWVNSGIVQSLDVIQPDGELQNNEVLLGLKSGKIKMTDERFVAYFDFMKKLSGYFNKDFNSISWEYEGLFNNGTALFELDGSWFPNQVMTNKLTVNYGVGPIPYVDSGIYAGARNQPVLYALGPGEAGDSITTKAQNEGRLDACIDFFQFLTDAKTGAKMYAEKTMFLPVVKGVEVPAAMKGVMDSIGTEKHVANIGAVVFNISSEHGSKFNEAYQKFLGDPKAKTADFCSDLQKLADKYVDIAISEVPEYSKIPDFLDKVK